MVSEIVRELTGASRVTIAIKNKNKDAAEIIKPLAEKKGYNIFITKNVYPAGDEFILVYDITGKKDPAERNSADGRMPCQQC